jgi:hypothetical protein
MVGQPAQDSEGNGVNRREQRVQLSQPVRAFALAALGPQELERARERYAAAFADLANGLARARSILASRPRSPGWKPITRPACGAGVADLDRRRLARPVAGRCVGVALVCAFAMTTASAVDDMQ